MHRLLASLLIALPLIGFAEDAAKPVPSPILGVSAEASHAEEIRVVAPPGTGVSEPLAIVHTASGDGVVVPPSWGDKLLEPCSRSTLGKGDEYWQPELSDVAAMEVAFANHRRQEPAPEKLGAWPEVLSYGRQYVGVTRGDRRTVYASFIPAESLQDDWWRRKPWQLCDGGPRYFGVEVELEPASVQQIAFDSSLYTVVPADNPVEATTTDVAGPWVPPLEGRVTDLADVLSPAERDRLERMLAGYEEETSHQIAVLLVSTLAGEDIDAFSLRVANTWGLGQKGIDNGVLVTLAMKERAVRIELGFGMEKYISNETAKSIIDGVMLPAFRKGDYAGGLEAGLEQLMGLGRRFVVPPPGLSQRPQPVPTDTPKPGVVQPPHPGI